MWKKYLKIGLVILFIFSLFYLTKFSTKNNVTLFNEACDLSEKGQYEKANELLNKAIEYNPYDLECYNNRAWNYFDLNKYELSEKDFNKILSEKPDNTLGLYGKGMIRFKQKKYKEALKYFNKIIYLTGGEKTLYLEMRLKDDRELRADITKVVYYKEVCENEIKPKR